MPWTSDLWQRLMELYPLPNGLKPLDVTSRQFKWDVKIIDEDKENNSLLKPNTNDIYENCVDAVFNKSFVTTILVSKIPQLLSFNVIINLHICAEQRTHIK